MRLSAFFGKPCYGEPIWDAGHRKHEGAGRPPIDRGLRARTRYMAAPLRLARMRCERGSVGVVLPASSRFEEHSLEGTGMRIIGLDIHRAFAEAVAWQEGKLKRIGRIDMRRDRLEAFAATLSSTDVVVVEAT